MSSRNAFGLGLCYIVTSVESMLFHCFWLILLLGSLKPLFPSLLAFTSELLDHIPLVGVMMNTFPKAPAPPSPPPGLCTCHSDLLKSKAQMTLSLFVIICTFSRFITFTFCSLLYRKINSFGLCPKVKLKPSTDSFKVLHKYHLLKHEFV